MSFPKLNQDTYTRQSDPAPTVSVIMNCLNGEEYLEEAIDSVYSQSFEDWEIVFWDNASTDRTAEIAQSYGRMVARSIMVLTLSLMRPAL